MTVFGSGEIAQPVGEKGTALLRAVRNTECKGDCYAVVPFEGFP